MDNCCFSFVLQHPKGPDRLSGYVYIIRFPYLQLLPIIIHVSEIIFIPSVFFKNIMKYSTSLQILRIPLFPAISSFFWREFWLKINQFLSIYLCGFGTKQSAVQYPQPLENTALCRMSLWVFPTRIFWPEFWLRIGYFNWSRNESRTIFRVFCTFKA